MPGSRPSPNKRRDEFENIRKEIRRRSVMLYQAIALEAYRRIVLKTPVDTGRARGNWQFETHDTNVSLATTDKSGGRSIAQAAGKAKDLTLDDVTWIVNNVVYIDVLENGGYPKNPKRGTYNKRTKRYEIRSINGFSKQAPHGMVSVTAAELEVLIPKLLSQVGG